MARGLGHHLLVDTQPPGGVDDHDVEVLGPRLREAGRGDGDRITGPAAAVIGVRRGARVRREDRDTGPLPHDVQLVDRARPLQVAGDQQRGVALVAQPQRQLAGQRGLTGTLQTGQHHHGRRRLGERQLAGLPAEDADQFLVDDLDDLLGRVEGAGDLRALGAVFDAADERPDDGQRYVGLQQRQPDFAGGGVDVGVGQPALAAKSLQGTGEPVGQRFKHAAQPSWARWIEACSR